MSRSSRVLLQLIAVACLPIAAFCLWGFLAAFEPGGEPWRIIYPVVFATTLVVGSAAAYFGCKR